MTYTFVLDALIAILLTATIVWCVLLNRRLGDLRRHQNELSTLIADLNEATSRAEAGIAGLKHNAEVTGATLQNSIENARRLNDDLSYLSERSEQLVDRLDGSTRPARRKRTASSPSPPIPAAKGQDRKNAEEALLNALRSMR